MSDIDETMFECWGCGGEIPQMSMYSFPEGDGIWCGPECYQKNSVPAIRKRLLEDGQLQEAQAVTPERLSLRDQIALEIWRELISNPLGYAVLWEDVYAQADAAMRARAKGGENDG